MSSRLSDAEAAEIRAFLADPTNDIYMRFAKSKTYPQRRGSVERLVAMCNARLCRATIHEIAAEHELNAERVRQLLCDCRRIGRRRMLARKGEQCNGIFTSPSVSSVEQKKKPS